MTRNLIIIPILFTFSFYLFPLFGQIPEQGGDDKTLSPFFFIQSEDASVDQLPLIETSALVDISGVIADVKVTQIYKNEGFQNSD